MLRDTVWHIQFTYKQPSAGLWDGWCNRLPFVLSQSNTPFILQIPKLFTFPHLALSRENIANTAEDAENIKVL